MFSNDGFSFNARHNKSMDIRARAATFLKRFLVSLTLRAAGFALRHLSRSAALTQLMQAKKIH
jgi:hypothetical protein